MEKGTGVYNALVRILLTGRAVQRKPAATLTCSLVRASLALGSLYPALVGYIVVANQRCYSLWARQGWKGASRRIRKASCSALPGWLFWVRLATRSDQRELLPLSFRRR
jgi:hypothetical protein